MAIKIDLTTVTREEYSIEDLIELGLRSFNANQLYPKVNNEEAANIFQSDVDLLYKLKTQGHIEIEKTHIENRSGKEFIDSVRIKVL